MNIRNLKFEEKKSEPIEVGRVYIDYASHHDFKLIPFMLSGITNHYPRFNDWYKKVEESDRLKRPVLLAKADNNILGVAIMKNEPLEKKICTFYVHSDYRNSGLMIGSNLMEKSLEKLGSGDVNITVSEDRLPFIENFLHNNGFTCLKKVGSLYVPSKSESFFVKTI